MAKAHGVSKATVKQIWQSHQIKPYRAIGFKFLQNTKFLERLTRMVGL